MPVFIVSHIAIKGRKIMPYVGMLRSSSLKSAKKTGNRRTEQNHPAADGWKHSCTVAEISKSTLEEMIKDAR